MSRGHRIVTTLIVGLLLLSNVAGVVAAQSAQPLFLNEEAERTGTVTLDGETYQVYRYENVVFYASGIEVYHQGERLTSKQRAAEVLTALAHKRAVNRLGPEDIEDLRTARRQARSLVNITGPTATTLNGTLSTMAELRETRVDGQTAWNASVEAAPKLAEFNETAREQVLALRETERIARTVVGNTTALLDLLEKRENGAEVDPQRLFRKYETTVNALDQLDGQSYEVDSLADVSAMSERIAANVSGVSDRGGELADRFESTAAETGQAANRTAAAFEKFDAVAGFGAALLQPADEADSMAATLIDRWQSRQNAARDVYGTLVGVPIAAAALVGYFRWRR